MTHPFLDVTDYIQFQFNVWIELYHDYRLQSYAISSHLDGPASHGDYKKEYNYVLCVTISSYRICSMLDENHLPSGNLT